MTLIDAYESLSLKFSSGNDIPVGRATILKEEWEAIKKALDEKQITFHSIFEDYNNNF